MSHNSEAVKDPLHLCMQETIKRAIQNGLPPTMEDPYFYRFIAKTGLGNEHLSVVSPSQFAVTARTLDLRLVLQPFVSKNQISLNALNNVAQRMGQHVISKFGYPLRGNIDNGTCPIYTNGHGMLVGSDIVLHLAIDNADKILQTQRGLGAPIFPGFWSCAGGCVTESPSRTGIKELNEETGIVLDTGKAKPYIYLLLRADGKTGLSRYEKAQSIGELRTYLTRRYPDSFDQQRRIKIMTLDLEPVTYPNWAPVTVTVSDDRRVIDSVQALPSFSPDRSSLTLLRPYALPQKAVGLPVLGDLKEGVNCFFAALEFGGERNIHPFSLPEMAAIQQAGKYFDNHLNLLHQTQMLNGIAPARQVLARTNEGILAPAF